MKNMKTFESFTDKRYSIERFTSLTKEIKDKIFQDAGDHFEDMMYGRPYPEEEEYYEENIDFFDGFDKNLVLDYYARSSAQNKVNL